MLELNSIQADDAEIKAKIKQLGLKITALSEDDITAVVNSFLSGKLSTFQNNQISQHSTEKSLDESTRKARGNTTSKSIQADIDAFREGVFHSSQSIAKNQADLIYRESIEALPSNVVSEFVALANQHKADPERFRKGGEEVFAALFADF